MLSYLGPIYTTEVTTWSLNENKKSNLTYPTLSSLLYVEFYVS